MSGKNKSKVSMYLSTRQIRGDFFLGSRRMIITNIPWYRRRPLLATFFGLDLQRASMFAVSFAFFICFLQLVSSFLEMCWLALASPGVNYHRTIVGFSMIFVYSGNQAVRWMLFILSGGLFVTSVFLLVVNVNLARGVYLEDERLFRKWIRTMALFIGTRFVVTVIQSIVNDMFFVYHQVSAVLWTLMMAGCGIAWTVVLSNFQELSDITKLEEMYGKKIEWSDDDEEDKAQEEEINRAQQQTEMKTITSSGSSTDHLTMVSKEASFNESNYEHSISSSSDGKSTYV